MVEVALFVRYLLDVFLVGAVAERQGVIGDVV
jgi:hypothetical protein